jgi:hypothetical protein
MSEEDREARRKLETLLRRSLAAAEIDGPTSEEVGAYVDGSLEPEDRAAFEEMLALDPALRDEVRDLQELREALGRAGAPSRRWVLWAGLAAAAGLAALLFWARPAPVVGPGVVNHTPLPSPILTLRDAARELTLRADGSLDGLVALPDETRGAVVAALREGSLSQPEGLGALRGQAGTLMGHGGGDAFRVLVPVATFVRSDRPTFRWTAQPHARAYELLVLSEELVKVASVRVSGTTEATLGSSLERGRTYVWQVAAITSEGRVVAPRPPEPEARFRVLAGPEAEALESALAAAGDSDLVAGVLLARAGARDEAETRLARLAAANPGSAEVSRLLAAVRR